MLMKKTRLGIKTWVHGDSGYSAPFASHTHAPAYIIHIRVHYLYTCVCEAKGALYPLSPSTSPLRCSSSPLHGPPSPLLMSFHFFQIEHTAWIVVPFVSLAEHASKTIQDLYRIEHLADSQEYILRKNVVNWRDVSPQRCWTLLRNVDGKYLHQGSAPKQVGPSHLLCVSIMAQNESLS